MKAAAATKVSPSPLKGHHFQILEAASMPWLVAFSDSCDFLLRVLRLLLLSFIKMTVTELGSLLKILKLITPKKTDSK